MSRKRRKPNPVPKLPKRVLVKVGNRIVAELAFGDDPNLIVPGSVAWRCDPAGISGPDRERSAASVVRQQGLDPKVDYERIYNCLWGDAPKRS